MKQMETAIALLEAGGATGTIVGIALGLAAVIAIIVLIVMAKKQAKKNELMRQQRQKERKARLEKAMAERRRAIETDEPLPEEIETKETFEPEKPRWTEEFEVLTAEDVFEEEDPDYEDEDDEEEGPSHWKRWAALASIVLISGIAVTIFMATALRQDGAGESQPVMAETDSSEPLESSEEPDESKPENMVETITKPDPEMKNGFLIEPRATAATSAAAMGINWEKIVNGELVSSFQRQQPITFNGPSEYFTLPGVSTFRGNNYRTGGAYGTVQMEQKKFSEPLWSIITDTLLTSDGESSWTGSGWTGQPLVVQWDDETRSHMNIYESKRNKAGLVEVIYATLDGNIYFLDLEDGEYTRDPIYIGMTFKGSGSLDPRGYPLMYVGSGDFTVGGMEPKMYVISLIDGSVLYEYGNSDPVAYRGWSGFDSSPLVDAETDTLIWPGENGILYTIQLNTQYDKAAGLISVDPDPGLKMRYTTSRSSDSSYWLGMECSANILDHYIFLSENGGMFYCIDLNTMELVWAQDTKDDSNSSPVAEYNTVTGQSAIYTAPSLHWTAEAGEGSISIYKLNALNGEIIWSKEYPCSTVEGVSGGVQASPVLGKAGSNIENLVIYPIARTPSTWEGVLVALDKNTGEEVWRYDMDCYTWSSPVAVYTEDGTAYLVMFDSEGNGFLMDGATGTILDQINVGSLVEASPVVYENRLVVGTRGQRVFAFDLK